MDLNFESFFCDGDFNPETDGQCIYYIPDVCSTCYKKSRMDDTEVPGTSFAKKWQ